MAIQHDTPVACSSSVPGCGQARKVAALAAAGLLLAATVLPQGGGLRTNPTATVGGTIQVEVGTSDPSIEVTNAATGETQSFPTEPGKRTSIPVPAVAPGSVLIVSVGRGRRAHIVLVEVVNP